MIRVVLSVLLLALVAVQVYGQPLELYSAEPGLFQYSGTGAVGSSRSQHFTPTTSTPGSLPATAFFSAAGMYLRVGVDTENANITMSLYQWDTDFDTTILGTPLAGPSTFDVTNTAPEWFEVEAAAPLSAGDSYLLRCQINSMTYVSSGFGVWKSDSDDGGPGNDAYNGNSARTDREYQVRLTIPPSTSVSGWELYR
jgi:hypothetical protein